MSKSLSKYEGYGCHITEYMHSMELVSKPLCLESLRPMILKSPRQKDLLQTWMILQDLSRSL